MRKGWESPQINSIEPFVGRSEELTTIQDVLQEHSQQSTKKAVGVLLAGDAGIGKTRLAQEIASWAQERCWCVLWCWLDEQNSSQVYNPWRSLLRTACAQMPWIVEKLKAHPDMQLSLIGLLPELNEWFFQEKRDEWPGYVGAERLWEAIATIFCWIGERTNLLLVIDDIHWLDSKSRDVLRFLFHQRVLPLALLATYRDSEIQHIPILQQLITEWRREDLYHTTLAPLNSEDTTELLKHYPNLDSAKKQVIITQSGGNPLFAEELAFCQQDQEAITLISPSIDAIFARRLSDLSIACQLLLEQGAIFGNVFVHEWMLYIAEKSGMDNEEHLLDVVEEALQARLLIESEQGTYQFWHPLLQEYLCKQLSPARGNILHRFAAVTLAALADAHEEYSAAIVYHLLQGEAAPILVTQWAERAGHRAYRLAAYPEAENFYKIALEHRQSTDLSSRALLAERLGECCAAQGNAHASCYFFERAILWRDGETPPQNARNALLWCELAFSWRYQGDIAEAMASREHAIRLIALLSEEEQIGVRAMICYVDASLLWQAGKHEEAFVVAQEAIQLFTRQLKHPCGKGTVLESFTRIEQTLRGSELDLARAQILLGTLAITLARYTQARTCLETALLVFEQHHALREIAKCCSNLGDLLIRIGDYTEAQEYLIRACGIAEQIGDQSGLLTALGNIGILAFRRGDLPKAQCALADASLLAERIGDPVYLCLCLIPASYVEQELNNFSQVGRLLKQAFQIGRAHMLTPCVVAALIALARLRLLQAQQAEQGGKSGERWRVRAQNTLRRALRQEHIELETRLEGELLQAEAFLQSADTSSAEKILMPLLAQEQACFWHYVWAQRLLGQLWAERGEVAQAAFWLEQALEAFEQRAMVQEEARTRHFLNVLKKEGEQ